MINNYEYQSDANIECLLEDVGYLERKKVLLKIVDEFSKENIGWGLGCSANLFLRGIVDEFHDFDLIVDGNDIPKAQKVMENLKAKLIGTGGNGFCESDHYFHYQLGIVDVEIIAGFRVKTYNTEYVYSYNFKEIDFCTIYEENKITIPMIPMEAQYLLYSMMEGWQLRRRFKRILIQEYLREIIEHRSILQKALEKDLPNWIKRNVRELLED